jgi:hypothetical protein
MIAKHVNLKTCMAFCPGRPLNSDLLLSLGYNPPIYSLRQVRSYFYTYQNTSMNILPLLTARLLRQYSKILLITIGGISLFIPSAVNGQNTAIACGQLVTYPLDGCTPCTQNYNNLNGPINFSTPNQTACVTGTSTITGINSTISDTIRICGNATITGPLSSWGTPVNIIVTSGSTVNWEIDPSAGASRNITNYGISNYDVGITNGNNVTFVNASSDARLNIIGNYTLNGVNTFVFLGGILNVTGTLTLNSSVNALCLSNNTIITTSSFETTADNNILVDPNYHSCISYSNSAVANGHYLTQDPLRVCQQVGASDPTYVGVPNFGPQVIVSQNCTDCQNLLTSLPITLQSFMVMANNKKEAILKWISAAEVNTDRFNIQRSNNGISFETIGTLNAVGNSSTPVTYTYTDKLPKPGTNYYRLKMLDKDGKYTYSPVKIIAFDGNSELKLINYTASNLLFALPQVRSKASIRLMNMQGRLLWQKDIPANQAQLTIPAARLATGIYIIQYSDSEKQTSQRVFVRN